MNPAITRLPSILVVIKNTSVRNTLLRALEDTHLEIQATASMQEAIQLLFTRGPIDLVICEPKYPEGDAIALQNWLQEQLVMPKFLILAPDYIPDQLRSNRRRHYLPCPFTVAQLRSAVNSSLEHLPGTLASVSEPTDDLEHSQAS